MVRPLRPDEWPYATDDERAAGWREPRFNRRRTPHDPGRYGRDHAWLSGRLIDDPEALRRLDRLARHEPSPTADGLRERQIEEFMGWLFRDGGAEPPRREYDATEQRLRLLVFGLPVPEPTGDWWTDGAMVNEGAPGDEGIVGDAATEDDAARIVERHNSILREARS